jgi:LmbE family N-acetylglucosaminyl deacetylase
LPDEVDPFYISQYFAILSEMNDSDLPFAFMESLRSNLIKPFLLNTKSKKFSKTIKSISSIITGKDWPRPLLEKSGPTGRIMVIAPHPDDEVLGCGGTIKKCSQAGDHVKILFFTDGRHGSTHIDESQLIDIRINEAKESMRILGCFDLTFLGWEDTVLRQERKTVEIALRELKAFQPDAIFVPHLFDNHPDHIESAFIIANALKKYEGNLSCYCYEVWTALFPNILIDITDVINFKKMAIDAHQSQAQLNLTDSIIGLNSYRALGLRGDVKFCEAFYKCSKKEFIRIALKQ